MTLSATPARGSLITLPQQAHTHGTAQTARTAQEGGAPNAGNDTDIQTRAWQAMWAVACERVGYGRDEGKKGTKPQLPNAREAGLQSNHKAAVDTTRGGRDGVTHTNSYTKVHSVEIGY
jgi:hypothetical protein